MLIKHTRLNGKFYCMKLMGIIKQNSVNFLKTTNNSHHAVTINTPWPRNMYMPNPITLITAFTFDCIYSTWTDISCFISYSFHSFISFHYLTLGYCKCHTLIKHNPYFTCLSPTSIIYLLIPIINRQKYEGILNMMHRW